MSRATFKILFYLKRNAPKKNGLIPVMCRITVNGKIAQFSCKLDVEEKMWSVETGRLTGRSNVALEGNRMLDKIRVGVNKAYQDVFDRCRVPAAQRGLRQISGQDEEPTQLLEILRGLQAPVGVHQNPVQGGGHRPERACARLHHGLRAVPPRGERALHQHRVVVHDAFPEHHLHRHQQRLVAA